MDKNNFVVFPSFGYWEIDGKPVSKKEAKSGLHPKAIWKETEVAKDMISYDPEITCFVCGKPITGKDYDNRYSWHEPDCPNTRADEGDEIVECECDIETHPHCIPDWVSKDEI